jgi:hypothetical protein
MANRTRFAVFRPSSGNWYTSFHGHNWGAKPHAQFESQCGTAGDIPVPGDYFGDGHIHHAVFRPSNGVWYIKGHGYGHWGSTSGNVEIQCGTAGDIPVPGDYFGEGRLRVAVFRPSNGTWYIKGPGLTHWGQTGGNVEIQCGTAGDIPVPADYYGEGRPRIAVFRPSNGVWYIKGHGATHWGQTGGNAEIQCGTAGDVPVPGDYHGMNHSQIAVWRPSNGVWYIKGHGFANWGQTAGNVEIQCGTAGDIPVPGDYSKSGRTQIAVFRPSNGVWYVKGHGFTNWGQTQGNTEVQCGTAGDVPVPLNFRKGNKPKAARKMHTPQNWTWLH